MIIKLTLLDFGPEDAALTECDPSEYTSEYCAENSLLESLPSVSELWYYYDPFDSKYSETKPEDRTLIKFINSLKYVQKADPETLKQPYRSCIILLRHG